MLKKYIHICTEASSHIIDKIFIELIFYIILPILF